MAQDAARQLREALAALQRDVAASFRICSRDFGVLGRELVTALQQRQRQEQAALEQERGRRRRLQRQLTEAQGGALRVLCRVRPPLPRCDPEFHTQQLAAATQTQTQDADSSPKLKHLRVHVAPEDAEVRVSSALDGALVKSFSFQRVFGEESTQELVFRDVAPLVNAALDGRHACVFAYGQVGAGKTHSMQGVEGDRGVYFRATRMVCTAAQEQQQHFDFTLSLQLVEIYNEEVYDLLAPGAVGAAVSQQQQQQQPAQFFSPPSAASSASASAASMRTAVEIRHGENGVYLKNVTTVAMDDEGAVHAAILRGAANRSVFATAKNELSSRSHSVLLIDIERRSKESGETTTGRLAIVDLAGSERLSRTKTTGQRLREAQYINKSLCAISDVMSALLAKEKHIPFRNSKLTHMLQDSLGGDSLTLLLIHVSPESSDVSETIDTLKFASRVTNVKVGGVVRGERSEISRLNAVITSQSNQLQVMQEKLSAELELRKKYEKRLEEYRQEETRRKSREDELKKQHALAPLTNSAMLSPEQQIAARRWSLYSRKDSIALKSANNARGLNGLENISENILRSRSTIVLLPEEASSTFNHASTPVREKRRQSVYKANLTPSEELSQLGKRANPSASEVKSILKKQRIELAQRLESASGAAQQSKQVSFHLSPRTPSPGSQSSLPPPRQPGLLLRTAPAAARVPAAGRVRAPVSSFSSSPVRRVVASTPARAKPKSNVGWR